MEQLPESYLLLNEITQLGGFTRFWNRCRESMKARALGMQDANRCWRTLRHEYHKELQKQPNTNP